MVSTSFAAECSHQRAKYFNHFFYGISLDITNETMCMATANKWTMRIGKRTTTVFGWTIWLNNFGRLLIFLQQRGKCALWPIYCMLFYHRIRFQKVGIVDSIIIFRLFSSVISSNHYNLPQYIAHNFAICSLINPI